ncbi:hypothetical protein [Bacillus sp. FSL K6-3431]|uniref:hypothetical protein n=1 Tax=Bacillus sp. FSL K6-3431 TaxID=2921500 RepID=UPI0030F576CF
MLRFRIPARLKNFIPVVVGAKNANADELSQTAGIAKETVSYVVVIYRVEQEG